MNRGGGPFLHRWREANQRTLCRDFALPPGALDSIEILLASYVADSYGGEAFVLFRQAGGLYEVNASHDSEASLEGQWEPEETLVAALRYRLERGRLGRAEDDTNLFADELRRLLAGLEQRVH